MPGFLFFCWLPAAVSTYCRWHNMKIMGTCEIYRDWCEPALSPALRAGVRCSSSHCCRYAGAGSLLGLEKPGLLPASEALDNNKNKEMTWKQSKTLISSKLSVCVPFWFHREAHKNNKSQNSTIAKRNKRKTSKRLNWRASWSFRPRPNGPSALPPSDCPSFEAWSYV